MGGRGSSSGRAGGQKHYTVDYDSSVRGQISKTDAGQLYKAVKNGDVTAKPELTQELYDGTKASVKFASLRYTQDSLYYDRVTNMTRALLNKDYKTAQKIINTIEKDSIARAGKKSRWYKYK